MSLACLTNLTSIALNIEELNINYVSVRSPGYISPKDFLQIQKKKFSELTRTTNNKYFLQLVLRLKFK